MKEEHSNQASLSATDSDAIAVTTARGTWPARVLRFPLRAALGLESIWIVLLVGALFDFATYKFTVGSLAKFLGSHPVPAYVVPIGYAGASIHALIVVWLSIAFWQTARRARSLFWRMSVSALAMILAVWGIWGALAGVRVVDHYFSQEPASVFESSQR